MEIPSRRTFLKVSGLAATAASYQRVLGANDRLRLGIIGTGNRGQYFLKKVQGVGGAEWVAVCDVFSARRDEAQTIIGHKVDGYSDYRRILERKDIDAVSISTTDVHHAKMLIDACHAGKDVYVEKPMTTAPEQGPEIFRVVRDTKRVVQVGMQQRSMPHFIEAKRKYIDTGMLGEIHMVHTHYHGAAGGYVIPVPPGMQSKPDGLDWEAWLGPLPKIAWDPKHYFNRFAYWDVSTGGQIGGTFIHMIDVAHWYLGLRGPGGAMADGGIYQFDDGRDTPDNVHAIVTYPQKLSVSFDASLTDAIPVRKYLWPDIQDICFIGSRGRLQVWRVGYKYTPAENEPDQNQVVVYGTRDESPHIKNWLDCIRTRQHPNATVVDGHYSATACHMANMSYRSKVRTEWNKQWDLDALQLPPLV
jgi:predicted dehydrogenase